MLTPKKKSCCDITFAQINYLSLNKQDSIEQVNGWSHDEVLVKIFMLYDVQLGGGVVKLSMTIINRKKQSMLNQRKPKFINKTNLGYK